MYPISNIQYAIPRYLSGYQALGHRETIVSRVSHSIGTSLARVLVPTCYRVREAAERDSGYSDRPRPMRATACSMILSRTMYVAHQDGRSRVLPQPHKFQGSKVVKRRGYRVGVQLGEGTTMIV